MSTDSKDLSVPAPKTGLPSTNTNPMELSKPEFLQGASPTGTELLRNYVVPPRLKVVQPTSKAPLCDMFKQGDLVAVPSMTLIDNKGGPGIIFTPIFFWPEWLLTNPRELIQLPYVRERSLDPRSPIAAKAKNPATREEKCPEDPSGKLKMNYVEVLNFMVIITSNSPVGLEPMLLSFQKAEHKAGTTFNALIRMRQAPLFGCQFLGKIGERTNTKGRWYGVDVQNPPQELASPWVANQDTFNAFGELHLQFKEYYENNLIMVDYDEPSEASPEVRDDM